MAPSTRVRELRAAASLAISASIAVASYLLVEVAAPALKTAVTITVDGARFALRSTGGLLVLLVLVAYFGDTRDGVEATIEVGRRDATDRESSDSDPDEDLAAAIERVADDPDEWDVPEPTPDGGEPADRDA